MLTFEETLGQHFNARGESDEPSYWTFEFGDGYQLTIEPLLWGQWYVAVYDKDLNLLTPKLPVRPGGRSE